MPRQSTPRPCDWLVNPGSFGKEGPLQWRMVDDRDLGSTAMFKAAVLQHAIVLTIRRARPRISWGAVAREMGLSESQVRRLMSGQAHLSMRDLVLLSDFLGPLFTLGPLMVEHIGTRENGWLFPTQSVEQD